MSTSKPSNLENATTVDDVIGYLNELKTTGMKVDTKDKLSKAVPTYDLEQQLDKTYMDMLKPILGLNYKSQWSLVAKQDDGCALLRHESGLMCFVDKDGKKTIQSNKIHTKPMIHDQKDVITAAKGFISGDTQDITLENLHERIREHNKSIQQKKIESLETLTGSINLELLRQELTDYDIAITKDTKLSPSIIKAIEAMSIGARYFDFFKPMKEILNKKKELITELSFDISTRDIQNALDKIEKSDILEEVLDVNTPLHANVKNYIFTNYNSFSDKLKKQFSEVHKRVQQEAQKLQLKPTNTANTAPKQTEPTAPKQTEPTAPKQTEPTAPKQASKDIENSKAPQEEDDDILKTLQNGWKNEYGYDISKEKLIILSSIAEELNKPSINEASLVNLLQRFAAEKPSEEIAQNVINLKQKGVNITKEDMAQNVINLKQKGVNITKILKIILDFFGIKVFQDSGKISAFTEKYSVHLEKLTKQKIYVDAFNKVFTSDVQKNSHEIKDLKDI